MKIGLRVPACRTPQEVAALAGNADAGKIDHVWVPDSQLLWRDAWITLGIAAAQTTSIALGTSVTNPKTRHPTVTASAASTLDELSGGRFVLGLGTGDSAVRVMGEKPATIQEMRDAITLLRALWRGEEVVQGGAVVHLNGATGREIPIHLAASGPKMLQLAGEVADGVILHTGVAADTIDWAMENLRAGARRRAQKRGNLEVSVVLYAYIGSNTRVAHEHARPAAAVYALRHWARLYGTEPRPSGAPNFGLYPDLNHAEDWGAAKAATRWVSDDLIRQFFEQHCIIGTAEDALRRIEDLQGRGITNLHLRGFDSYELPDELCDSLVSQVIPAFSGEHTPVTGLRSGD